MSHIAFTHLRHSVPSSPCFFLVRRAFRKPRSLRPEAKSEGRNTCPWRRRIGLRSIWTDWTMHHKWAGTWWAAPMSTEGAGWCCLRPLLIISERSLWSEEVSEDYKKAKVHPVFKKEDPVSYRLVSIMSVPEDNESWSPFSEVKWQFSDRERASGHKLKHGRLRLNIRKHLPAVRGTGCWSKLSRGCAVCIWDDASNLSGHSPGGCCSCPCLSRRVYRQILEVPPNLSDSVTACADSTGFLLRLKSEIGAPSSGCLSTASLGVCSGRQEYSVNVQPSALLVTGTICLWLFKPSYHFEVFKQNPNASVILTLVLQIGCLHYKEKRSVV